LFNFKSHASEPLASLRTSLTFRGSHGSTFGSLIKFQPGLQVFVAVNTAEMLCQQNDIAPAFAQGPPPSYSPDQLEQMVSRVALYPDSLVAQIFAAATYSDQIPDAARWANEHHYLHGQTLADAIQGDQLPWDPSVQALLPFPSVLEIMASDMNWTTDLGNAFLEQQQDVMEAVQRERRRARDYGYLRSNGQIIVSGGPYITIMPSNPAFVVVPYYDPRVVFYAPRPGIYVPKQ